MEASDIALPLDDGPGARAPRRSGRLRRIGTVVGKTVAFLAALSALVALAVQVMGLHVSFESDERYSELRMEHEVLETELGRLLRERGDLATTNEALQREVVSLRADNGRLEDQVETLVPERDSLRFANGELQRQLEAASARADAEAKSADGLRAELDPLRDEVASYRRILHAPPSGWVIFGEPCHSDDGHGGRHPRMHNRNFEPDLSPCTAQGANVFVVRELTIVWPSQPIESTRDRYSVPFVYDEGEWYPPEETSGVLVPGQRVEITRTFPIAYGPTFVEYRLL